MLVSVLFCFIFLEEVTVSLRKMHFLQQNKYTEAEPNMVLV